MASEQEDETLLKTCLASGVAVSLLLLSGCSQPTTSSVTEKTEAKSEPVSPAVPVTAKTAFWPMYTSARDWAKDLQVLRVASKELPGYKNEDGKAGIWEVTFASPSLQAMRTYSYAIAACPPDVYKGVTIGRASPWSGPTRDVMPIQISEFATDSDAAYKAAEGDAASWLKKHPGKPVTDFELGNAYKFQAPVWYVMWGDKKLGYRAFVNATTGKVLNHK